MTLPPDTTSTDMGGQALNEFAILMQAAQITDCRTAVATKLQTKLTAYSLTNWQQTWSGGALSMVLATGLILGAQGQLSADLDRQIVNAANNWTLTLQPGCGFQYSNWSAGNTCTEEYAIAAQAQGWRAAYYRLTGRDWFATKSSALTHMRTTLGDITNCLVDDTIPYSQLDANNRGPCAGLAYNLDTTARVVTINHSVQNPAYGIGQMTALAAGAIGLEVSKDPVIPANFNDVNKDIAQHFWREGNQSAATNGSFETFNCVRLNSDMTFSTGEGCWDTQKAMSAGYRADMFPVSQFYTDYGLPKDSTSNWSFTTFNANTFDNTNLNAPFGAGRYVSYYTFGYHWLDSVGGRPPMRGRSEWVAGIKRISNYVTNTGTGTPAATATTRSAVGNGSYAPSESFTIVDLDPSDSLLTNDPVAIRNKDGWYWQAANGGGSTLQSNASSATGNAVFTIVKISADATDPIAHNDLFALKTANGYNYVVAAVGGSLSATSTQIITDEQFRIERWKTE